MPNKALKEFLDTHQVKYLCINHTPTYTAQEIAAAAHVPGKQMAKTVIVKIDGKLAMVVLPAHDHVSFSVLKQVTGSNDIDLAREADFKNSFPECEIGAMPPFGNLYNMPVYVSKQLSHDHITFNSGTHAELVQMSYEDFIRLVKPIFITTH